MSLGLWGGFALRLGCFVQRFSPDFVLALGADVCSVWLQAFGLFVFFGPFHNVLRPAADVTFQFH